MAFKLIEAAQGRWRAVNGRTSSPSCGRRHVREGGDLRAPHHDMGIDGYWFFTREPIQVKQ